MTVGAVAVAVVPAPSAARAVVVAEVPPHCAQCGSSTLQSRWGRFGFANSRVVVGVVVPISLLRDYRKTPDHQTTKAPNHQTTKPQNHQTTKPP